MKKINYYFRDQYINLLEDHLSLKDRLDKEIAINEQYRDWFRRNEHWTKDHQN